MSSLIVSLPPAVLAHAGLELPYALVSDSAMLTRSGVAALAQWPKASELVLQVPASMLTWLQVDLPRPGRSLPGNKLRAVLEGLVEEQVLSDVAALHLALPPQAPGGEKTWVAACDKAWLAGWLQLLEAQGRPAARIVPEAQPQQSASLHISGSPDAPQFTYTDAKGVVSAPLVHADTLLPADLSGVQMSAEPAVAAQAQRFLPEDGSLPIVQTPQYLTRALGSEWNLGQFDLATSGSGRVWQRLLRLARQMTFAPEWQALRVGALLLVLAHLVGLNVWAWKEKTALAAQQKQLRATVTSITGATYVSDTPVQQAQLKLQALRQATGTLTKGDAEPQLAVLAAGLPPMPPGTELSYEGQSLRMRAPALSADALQNLRSAAAAAGYQVRTAGATLTLSLQEDMLQSDSAAGVGISSTGGSTGAASALPAAPEQAPAAPAGLPGSPGSSGSATDSSSNPAVPAAVVSSRSVPHTSSLG